jgi:uncharacterized protein (DUF2235 family)
MPRNLIICCDGTNNEFGTSNTNVVRLIQSLAQDPVQLVYYDPGIGTFPEPGYVTATGKRVSEAVDLAFATGLEAKVQRAYTYLMDTWEPGDQVYLFGFSRGAYTVRVLAGMLHEIGLLPARSHNLLPYAMRLYASLSRERRGDRGRRTFWDVSDAFRRTFARAVPGHTDHEFPIRFVGVWDTVSSVGWAWDPVHYAHTVVNPSIQTARHAISLDERRAFFRQHRMRKPQGRPQDLEERWFPGVHSDVGGGYADGGLWRAPFRYITRAAARAGLRVDPARYRAVLREGWQPHRPAWGEGLHDSLTALWLPAEVYPKLSFSFRLRRRVPRLNLASARFVEDGSVLHRSLVHRIAHNPRYRPRNLTPAFIKKVVADAPRGDLAYTP